MRRSTTALASVLATLALSSSALADATPPPPDSWAGQVMTLASAMQRDETCKEHCFALEHMKLTGSAVSGALEFELKGGVLGKGEVDVPLVGAPSQVRLDDVTIDGAPALVGFDGDHYFVRTGLKRFTIAGKIKLGADRALFVSGPLNTLDATLKEGHVTEGAALTGVSGTTLHFDSERTEDVAQPSLFQMSRALRVGKKNEFEYRVSLRAPSELGVVRLPLSYGETVLSVSAGGQAVEGWKVEAGELLAPLVGKSAELVVTGEIAKLSSFTPDSRSPYEWWLIENDAEHRVLASGDGKQHDSSESPIPRREPNSKLYLVSKGQHLDLSVQTLATLDVLAAVVSSHSRTLVLTEAGDLFTDDTISYDNSGIDYLMVTPTGKPIYLATDGTSELLMHKDGGKELMVPLHLGSHSARTQSLDHADTSAFGGVLRLPSTTFPLATSHAQVSVGLPKSVHALAVLGGDEAEWAFGLGDGLALGASAIASLLALRGRRNRALGMASLSGLWFLSPGAFLGVLATGAAASAVWATGRLFEGRKRTFARVGLGVAAIAALGMMTSRGASKSAGLPFRDADVATLAPALDRSEELADKQNAKAEAEFGMIGMLEGKAKDDLSKHAAMGPTDAPQAQGGRMGNWAAQTVSGGIVDGVRPVVMPLPSYDHAVSLSRQVVTSDRPLDVRIVYVTSTTLTLLGLGWAACAIALAWTNRDKLRAMKEAIDKRLAKQPEAPAPAESATPAE